MKVIESYGDTDFVWSCGPTKEPTTLIAYYQSEQGFASFIAGASLVGEDAAVCNVLSKLHPIDPINTLPSPTVPAWRLYETRNEDGRRYFILRINQTYIPTPTQTKAWLYNYPVFRDITMCLSKYGVDELVYLTSNLMQDFMYSDQAQIPENELIVYDYNERDESLYLTDGSSIDFVDVTLPPPSWVFASCFGHFCSNRIRGNYIVIASKNHTTFVNEREGERILEFLEDTHALLPDQMYKSEFLQVLYEAESELQ